MIPARNDQRAEPAVARGMFSALLPCALLVGALLVGALAAGVPTRAGAEAPPAPFQPSELSIGEPLPLPGAPRPNPAATGPLEPRPSPLRSVPPPPLAPPATPAPLVGRPPARLPETGWLGCVADDSLNPGRLTVVEVSPQGPAALAGIQPRDTLLAIDGAALKNADGWAATLAAISPGKTVRIAIGRPLGGPGSPEQIAEVVVTATARPPRPEAAQWQASTKTTAATAAPESPAAFVPPRPSSSPQPRPGVPAQPLHGDSRRSAEERLAAAQPVSALAAAPASGRLALGVRTLPVDAEIQSRYRLPEPAGAWVLGVVHALPASIAGIPPGAVIVALDHQPVRSPEELTRLVAGAPVGRAVRIEYVLSGGVQRHAEVELKPLDAPLQQALMAR